MALQVLIASGGADTYAVIAARNIFGLQPISPPSSDTAPLPSPPKEDLQLTGLISSDSTRCAMFRVVATGKPSISFSLAEGETNDWLKVLSVDAADQTVKVSLKRPVMRIRAVGVDVLLAIHTCR